MERIDLFIKTTVGIVGGLISYLVHGVGMAFAILLLVMLADFITGLLVGFVTKEVSSKVGTKGLIKKTYIIILIGVVYIIEKNLFGSSVVGDGATFSFLAIEFVSLIENGGKLGVPIPEPIKNFISTLKPRKKVD